MNKIHSFFAVYLSSFFLLVLLLIIIMFYNNQSDRIKTLALESITLLAEWNKLENETNDLLLNRFTHFGKKSSPIIDQWDKNYHDFGQNLEILMMNPIIRSQPEMRDRLEGAYRVWRFTQVRLNNASSYFKQIIQSGLGERVMVNGMLHTMYQLRMEQQLKVSEIFLLEETIYALESLDNTTNEFDFLFSAIVHDMKTTGEKHLKRIRLLFIAMFFSIVIILGLSLLINHQLKTAQNSRKQYIEGRKKQLLKGICENSAQDELVVFRNSQKELDIRISLDEPVLIVLLQINDYLSFSHRFNLKEQQELTMALCTNFLAYLSGIRVTADFFQHTDDILVFLMNTGTMKEITILQQQIRQWHETFDDRQPLTVSLTGSDFCFETEDLDHDFEQLLRLSEYRYLLGKKAFITPGSWKPHPADNFRYPQEKERLFEEAFKSLDQENTLYLLSEMIRYAEPYGPESVKRLILRLTAAQSSVVEILEKSYHISGFDGVTPMILEIQKKETLSEAAAMLEGIVVSVISSCLRNKAEKHDQTVVMIKDIIMNELDNLNLSAELIAARFNLSSSYINRLFKQQTSLSIAGYINKARLQRAEELLRACGLTVSQAAEQAGFSSMGTFFRLFKKQYGQTPGEMAARIQDSCISDSDDT